MNYEAPATLPSVAEAAALRLQEELPVRVGLAGRLWRPFSIRWWSSVVRIHGKYADTLLAVQHAENPVLIGLASKESLVSVIDHSDLMFLMDPQSIEPLGGEDLVDCLMCAVRELQQQVTWGSHEEVAHMVSAIEASPPGTVLEESENRLLHQVGVELRRSQEVDMDLGMLDTITTYRVSELEQLDVYLRGVRVFLQGGLTPSMNPESTAASTAQPPPRPRARSIDP